MQDPMSAARSLTTFYSSVGPEDAQSPPPQSTARQLPPTFTEIVRAEVRRGLGYVGEAVAVPTALTSDRAELPARFDDADALPSSNGPPDVISGEWEPAWNVTLHWES